jgi:thiamine-phosphate pyrophosphorylase
MRSERWRGMRGVYAITPQESDTRKLLAQVAASLGGGAAAVQYRAKSLPAALAREQAKAIASLCRAQRVPLIVNDSLELALAVGADGVHLGREDGDVRAARARIGERIIGVSCYDQPALARDAAAAGADYVAIGSLFASSTKPGAVHAPLSLLAEAKRVSGLPVVAIGGIDAANAERAIAAGADMLAVISAIFDAADVRGATRSIANLFENSASEPRHVRA